MDAFIGEIRAFANTFCPNGWLPCYGQQVSIRDFPALYSIVQQYYGPSDLRTYFTLPYLQGCTFVGAGGTTGIPLGYMSGTEAVTLEYSDIAAHTHVFYGATGGDSNARISTADTQRACYLSNFGYKVTPDATVTAALGYVAKAPTPVNLNPLTISYAGGNIPCLPHENRAPSLVIRHCICALDGDYPPKP